MTSVHRAFRNRRSLLQPNLRHQVRVDELPWVRVVQKYRRTDGAARANAHTALTQLGGRKEQVSAIAWTQDALDRQPPHTVRRLGPVLAGLRHVLTSAPLDDGSAPHARRLLGWSTTGHWMTA